MRLTWVAAVLPPLQIPESSALGRSQKTGRVRRCRHHRDRLNAAELWIDHSREVDERPLDRPAPPARRPSRTGAARAAEARRP